MNGRAVFECSFDLSTFSLYTIGFCSPIDVDLWRCHVEVDVDLLNRFLFSLTRFVFVLCPLFPFVLLAASSGDQLAGGLVGLL